MDILEFRKILDELNSKDSICGKDFQTYIQTLSAIAKSLAEENNFEATSIVVKIWIGKFKQIFSGKKCHKDVKKVMNKHCPLITSVFFDFLQSFRQHEPTYFQELFSYWMLFISPTKAEKRAECFVPNILNFKTLIDELMTSCQRWTQLPILCVLILYTERVPSASFDILKVNGVGAETVDRLIRLIENPTILNKHAFLSDINTLRNSIESVKPRKIICKMLRKKFDMAEYDIWIDFNIKDKSITIFSICLADSSNEYLAVGGRIRLRENLYDNNLLEINGVWSITRNSEHLIKQKVTFTVFLLDKVESSLSELVRNEYLFSKIGLKVHKGSRTYGTKDKVAPNLEIEGNNSEQLRQPEYSTKSQLQRRSQSLHKSNISSGTSKNDKTLGSQCARVPNNRNAVGEYKTNPVGPCLTPVVTNAVNPFALPQAENDPNLQEDNYEINSMEIDELSSNNGQPPIYNFHQSSWRPDDINQAGRDNWYGDDVQGDVNEPEAYDGPKIIIMENIMIRPPTMQTEVDESTSRHQTENRSPCVTRKKVQFKPFSQPITSYEKLNTRDMKNWQSGVSNRYSIRNAPQTYIENVNETCDVIPEPTPDSRKRTVPPLSQYVSQKKFKHSQPGTEHTQQIDVLSSPIESPSQAEYKMFLPLATSTQKYSSQDQIGESSQQPLQGHNRTTTATHDRSKSHRSYEPSLVNHLSEQQIQGLNRTTAVTQDPSKSPSPYEPSMVNDLSQQSTQGFNRNVTATQNPSKSRRSYEPSMVNILSQHPIQPINRSAAAARDPSNSRRSHDLSMVNVLLEQPIQGHIGTTTATQDPSKSRRSYEPSMIKDFSQQSTQGFNRTTTATQDPSNSRRSHDLSMVNDLRKQPIGRINQTQTSAQNLSKLGRSYEKSMASKSQTGNQMSQVTNCFVTTGSAQNDSRIPPVEEDVPANSFEKSQSSARSSLVEGRSEILAASSQQNRLQSPIVPTENKGISFLLPATLKKLKEQNRSLSSHETSMTNIVSQQPVEGINRTPTVAQVPSNFCRSNQTSVASNSKAQTIFRTIQSTQNEPLSLQVEDTEKEMPVRKNHPIPEKNDRRTSRNQFNTKKFQSLFKTCVLKQAQKAQSESRKGTQKKKRSVKGNLGDTMNWKPRYTSHSRARSSSRRPSEDTPPSIDEDQMYVFDDDEELQIVAGFYIANNGLDYLKTEHFKSLSTGIKEIYELQIRTIHQLLNNGLEAFHRYDNSRCGPDVYALPSRKGQMAPVHITRYTSRRSRVYKKVSTSVSTRETISTENESGKVTFSRKLSQSKNLNVNNSRSETNKEMFSKQCQTDIAEDLSNFGSPLPDCEPLTPEASVESTKSNLDLSKTNSNELPFYSSSKMKTQSTVQGSMGKITQIRASNGNNDESNKMKAQEEQIEKKCQPQSFDEEEPIEVQYDLTLSESVNKSVVKNVMDGEIPRHSERGGQMCAISSCFNSINILLSRLREQVNESVLGSEVRCTHRRHLSQFVDRLNLNQRNAVANNAFDSLESMCDEIMDSSYLRPRSTQE